MLNIGRILCPIDFSDASRRALDHAVLIAGWYGSQVTALHVYHPAYLVEPPIFFAEFPGGVLPTAVDRGELEERLRSWLAPAQAAGVSAETRLETSNHPAERILECAASLPADLLVLGTHGRGGFERLLLGSVTEKVLRKAACPVLTVPPPAVATSQLPFKRLVCPVDFSDSSLTALRFALSIAKEADAHLTILHVFEWPTDEGLFVERTFDVPEFRRQIEQQARWQLDGLLSEDERLWCKPETLLAYGKPYRQILTVAERDHADLIVMGVQGRNALDLMLFGSTTTRWSGGRRVPS